MVHDQTSSKAMIIMKNASFIRTLFLPMLALWMLSCKQPAPAPVSSLPTVQMKIGSKEYQLEVAADDYSRQRGLMERDSMPNEHGMIFAFSQDTSEGFWMHNTRIPLDILFIDQSGKVVSVRHMKPFDESITSAGGSYRYAIELNDGAASASGVKPGDTVSIPAGIAH
jgi:uncharacterized membrane protein (UPF0127 family)